ncbi:MAG: ATP-binding protein [Sneathiella sp.]
MKVLMLMDKSKRDTLIGIVVIVIAFALSSYFDLAEEWQEFSEDHEDWELDEILVALGLSSIGLTWYAFRRWKESNQEIQARVKANRALEQEIEARKGIEASLRENDLRLREASKIAKIGYYVWDAKNTECTYVSKEHAKIYGLMRDDYKSVVSKAEEPFSLVLAKDHEIVREEMAYLGAGRTTELEYRVLTPDGALRYVRELIRPSFDENGQLAGWTSTSQNITALKQVEERMREVQKLESVAQLTGGVAHDFNNLLAIIVGNAELLKEQAGTDGKTAQNILSAAEKGSVLTQSLLAFSRMQPLDPETTDLEMYVYDLARPLKSVLGNDIALEFKMDQDLWRTVVDTQQLESAILNIAQNAKEAMPGGGSLTINCRNIRKETGKSGAATSPLENYCVQMSFVDTGRGMLSDVMEHAFDPFYTTKEVGAGSGLGLSMVYGFAKQSGGDVSINSEGGKGTTVNLMLPRA